jgi:hypothetical protein
MRKNAMRWSTKSCLAIIVIAGTLSLAACANAPTVSADRDLAMISHPELYRGAQHHPHAHGLNTRQTDLDLAPGVAYNGCTTVLKVSMRDADAGKGLDCNSAGRTSFEPGVRYGDCTVVRPITLIEAENGTGLLCDTEAGQMRAALEGLPRSVAKH